MAEALAGAFRQGIFDFELLSGRVRLNLFEVDFDDDDIPIVQLMPSRYRLLGYPIRALLTCAPPEPEETPLPVRTRILGTTTPGTDYFSRDSHLIPLIADVVQE